MDFTKIFLDKRRKFEESAKEREKILGKPLGVYEKNDIPYAEDGDPAHRMDVFSPLNRTGEALPVIMNIHGGGLLMGNKEFNRHFCAELAKRNFVVFSIEYSLVPEVQVYSQYRDIMLAMNEIQRILADYNGDKERVYVVGDSGGAYLAAYTAAMCVSSALAQAADIVPADVKVKAMAFISGMFYTTKLDEIGLFMPKYLYGKQFRKCRFAPYSNPEHKDIVASLPPSLLITSRYDNLKHYTLNYAKALARHHVKHELLYYEAHNRKLTHAFCVFEPYMRESQDVIDKIAQFLQQYGWEDDRR